MGETDAGLVSTLERVEREAWVDLYNAAPDQMRSLIGIRVEEIGTAAALILSTIDYPDFNRVIGLGVDEPATEQILDRFLELYRAAGIRKFLIHVAPTARPANLRDWLKARGLIPARRWAKRTASRIRSSKFRPASGSHRSALQVQAPSDAPSVPVSVCRIRLHRGPPPWLAVRAGANSWPSKATNLWEPGLFICGTVQAGSASAPPVLPIEGGARKGR